MRSMHIMWYGCARAGACRVFFIRCICSRKVSSNFFRWEILLKIDTTHKERCRIKFPFTAIYPLAPLRSHGRPTPSVHVSVSHQFSGTAHMHLIRYNIEWALLVVEKFVSLFLCVCRHTSPSSSLTQFSTEANESVHWMLCHNLIAVILFWF